MIFWNYSINVIILSQKWNTSEGCSWCGKVTVNFDTFWTCRNSRLSIHYRRCGTCVFELENNIKMKKIVEIFVTSMIPYKEVLISNARTHSEWKQTFSDLYGIKGQPISIIYTKINITKIISRRFYRQMWTIDHIRKYL